MRALHRYLRLALFAMVCMWVLTVPAPAVAAVRLPTPAGWPLSGSPVVQRGFDPPTVAWGSGHRGIDLAAKPGDVVLAAADGTVAFVGSIAGKPVISLDHGPVRTTYEPVISTLQVGERVALGQVIGQVGQGGHCRGCLHWGLREGKKYLNPLLLLGNGSGQLRLVAETQRTIAERAAKARAAAASATPAGLSSASVGRPGSHGFLRPGPWRSDLGVRHAAASGAEGLETARRHRLRRRLWHRNTCAVCRSGDAGLLQPRVRESAVRQPRPRCWGSGRDSLQSRRAVSGPARTAGHSGPGDRCGGEYGPLDRLSSAPDAVAQWATQQPDELVVTRLCPELVEGRTSTSSARNRQARGWACSNAARNRSFVTWV